MNAVLLLIIEVALLAVFHVFLGVGKCNFHDVTPIRVVATAIYVFLIFWGLQVGNSVSLNSQIHKDRLANPTFARRFPGLIFIVHFAVCVFHSLFLGPYFLINGLRKWYWTSFVAMLVGSLPIVPFNYNPQSFGKAVGRFVMFRNIFELSLSLYYATTLGDDEESFRKLSSYHYWIWGYRLLDVGPRRLMKKLLVPSSQMLFVLIIIYIVAVLSIQNDLVLFAGTPICNDGFTEESWIMHSGRILYCFAVYMGFWLLQRSYVKEVAATDGFVVDPPPPMGWHDDNVKNKGKHD